MMKYNLCYRLPERFSKCHYNNDHVCIFVLLCACVQVCVGACECLSAAAGQQVTSQAMMWGEGVLFQWS